LVISNEVAVGRLTLETTFDESDSPQSRFVRSSPFVSSTLPYRQCLSGWRTDLTSHSARKYYLFCDRMVVCLFLFWVARRAIIRLMVKRLSWSGQRRYRQKRSSHVVNRTVLLHYVKICFPKHKAANQRTLLDFQEMILQYEIQKWHCLMTR
uniref:Homeobox domain-containing protein n=1 Tax=Elaeophora elaphi TaxID=1147741 RepID=A0A0R3RXF9_9BILA